MKRKTQEKSLRHSSTVIPDISAVQGDLSREQLREAAVSLHRNTPTLMMLVLLAALGAIFYASFIFNPANRGDLLPFSIVMFAETYLILQALLSLWTILAGTNDPRPFKFHENQSRLLGGKINDISQLLSNKKSDLQSIKLYLNGSPVTVDVFITVYGEDLATVSATAVAARDMAGKHATYILDDGDSDEVRDLAKQLDIGYIRRLRKGGAKAGNINHALRITTGRFFAVFDADFVPDRLFLYETIPFFEDSTIAFVQTPQHYNNMNNMLTRGAGFMQHVFYSLIMTGKNRFNAAFCVGTNVVFRRSAIEKIGGIYSQSKSEDIWTSVQLHLQGYQSKYIPNVLAVGKTPESIVSYARQQLRWATGGFEIFFRLRPLSRKSMTIDQRIQYFGTATYYFNGIAIFLLLLLPPLQIYFNLTPVDLSTTPLTWMLYYSSFYIMQIIVAFYVMGGFRFETLILATATFPIYVKAFFNALFRRDQAWEATGTTASTISPFMVVRTQTYIFIFLFLTSIAGIIKAQYTSEISVSLFWNIINTIVFGTFFVIALKEASAARKARKAQLSS